MPLRHLSFNQHGLVLFEAEVVEEGGGGDEGGGGGAFEFVGASSGTRDSNGVILQVPIVPDVVEGDTLVAFYVAAGDPLDEASTPGSWTTIDLEPWADTGQKLAILTRLVTASEPAEFYQFYNVWTQKALAVVVAYRGSYEPAELGAWTKRNAIGTVQDFEPLTTAEDAIVIAVHDHYPFEAQNPAAQTATDMTQRVNIQHTSGVPAIAFLYDSDAVVPAGEYDTQVNGSNSGGGASVLFALTPA